MSACWHLDFNHDWLEYFSTDVASAPPSCGGREAVVWTEHDHTNFSVAYGLGQELWHEIVGLDYSSPRLYSVKPTPQVQIRAEAGHYREDGGCPWRIELLARWCITGIFSL